jgi:hypothetical protein
MRNDGAARLGLPIGSERGGALLMDGPNLVLDFAQIRSDARSGKLSIEDLLDVLDKLRQTIRRLEADKRRLTQRLAQYEPQPAPGATTPTVNPPTPNGSYSVDAENQRRQGRRRRKKKSPGRIPTELKFAEADPLQDIYPAGVRRADCQLARERAVWRLIDNQAVRVGYRIFAGPDGKEPRIPGVTPRCEYGLEILVVLAFLVYLIGIALDKACAVLGFFCPLPLSKSQADALLRQLANHWEEEYDTSTTPCAR